MSNDDSRRWERQLREAAARAEEELRRVVTYINDEVVPEVRRNGSEALRAASNQLQQLAQHLDDHRAAAHERQPPVTSAPGTSTSSTSASSATTPESTPIPERTAVPDKDKPPT